MAERRMFAKTIIDSDAFLEMPQSSQNLYFHLAMRADDDGFINNPKSIMRLIGCKDDDANILIAKKFLIPFESGVVVIKHWKIHNYIRNDRYNETKYIEEKSQLEYDENGTYRLTSGIPLVDERLTSGIPLVDERLTQVRLGKVRLGKDRLERGDKPHARKKYGEYNHVLLTDEQYRKLVTDFSADKITEYIKKIDEYCQQYGKSYKDYNLTIRKWILSDDKKKPERNYEIIPDKEGKIF